jgi:hypothetical protein
MYVDYLKHEQIWTSSLSDIKHEARASILNGLKCLWNEIFASIFIVLLKGTA